MNLEGFIREHQSKAPTRGKCWKLVTDYFEAVFVTYKPANREDFKSTAELMHAVLVKRMEQCDHLMSLRSNFPPETVAELEKWPDYPMSTDAAKRWIKENNKSSDVKKLEVCVETLMKKMSELHKEHGHITLVRNLL